MQLQRSCMYTSKSPSLVLEPVPLISVAMELLTLEILLSPLMTLKSKANLKAKFIACFCLVTSRKASDMRNLFVHFNRLELSK